MTVGDTPTIIFTGMNDLSGCKDNIAFDITLKDPELIKEIYQKFIDAGSKNNIALSKTANGTLQCSVIDPFGICFTMLC